MSRRTEEPVRDARVLHLVKLVDAESYRERAYRLTVQPAQHADDRRAVEASAQERAGALVRATRLDAGAQRLMQLCLQALEVTLPVTAEARLPVALDAQRTVLENRTG